MNYKYSTHPLSKQSKALAKYVCENYGKLSIPQIMRIKNQSMNGIKQILALNNIERLRPGHFGKGKIMLSRRTFKSSEQEDSVIKYYNKCGDRQMVMNKFGLKHASLTRLFQRRKVNAITPAEKLILSNKKLLIDTYCKQGNSINTTARTLKVKKATVERALEILKLKRPKGSQAFRNNRYQTPDGYILVTIPFKLQRFRYNKKKNTIGEHRLVMMIHLNRQLTKDETVHHKNGNRADNRLENLELWSKYQPAGQRVQDKLKWAYEIIEQYKDFKIIDK